LVVAAVDKKDFLKWSRKYDKDLGWLAQKENELGARFRRTKVMTRGDLAEVVEWQFRDAEEKKARVLELVAKNDEAAVERVSGQVFSVPSCDDTYRMNCLTMLQGVSPVLASVVLSFFDPQRYGVFDVQVWRALLGNEPPNLFTTANYLRLLLALRKTAAKQNLEARTIEKALVKMKLDEPSGKKGARREKGRE
jgi:hypothetical protein